jgi:hypothetical protein
MVSIYYDSDGESYQVDEISQRLLVYIYLHSGRRFEDVVEPIGAENEHIVYTRVENQLGQNAAGLLTIKTTDEQMTLSGENIETEYVALTDKGEEFVEEYRADLSMPVEIAELAKRVAELQIENGLVEQLIDRIDTLEERISTLEDN